MGVSQAIFGDNYIFDISNDTVTPETLLKGYTAHAANGDPIVGIASASDDNKDNFLYIKGFSNDELRVPIDFVRMSRAYVYRDVYGNNVNNLFNYSFNNSSISFRIGNDVTNCERMFSGVVIHKLPIYNLNLPENVTSCAYMFYRSSIYSGVNYNAGTNQLIQNNFIKYGYTFNMVFHKNIKNVAYMFSELNNSFVSGNFIIMREIQTPYPIIPELTDYIEDCSYYYDYFRTMAGSGVSNKWFNDPKHLHIPNNAINCSGLFSNSYINTPIIIPNNVINCDELFRGCVLFNSPVTLPNGVKNCSGLFRLCYNFNQPVILPESVENVSYMFYEASNFNSPLIMPSNIKDCYAFGKPYITNFNNNTFYLKDGCVLSENLMRINYGNFNINYQLNTDYISNININRSSISFDSKPYLDLKNHLYKFVNCDINDLIFDPNISNGNITLHDLYFENCIINGTILNTYGNNNILNIKNIVFDNCVFGSSWGVISGAAYEKSLNVYLKNCDGFQNITFFANFASLRKNGSSYSPQYINLNLYIESNNIVEIGCDGTHKFFNFYAYSSLKAIKNYVYLNFNLYFNCSGVVLGEYLTNKSPTEQYGKMNIYIHCNVNEKLYAYTRYYNNNNGLLKINSMSSSMFSNMASYNVLGANGWHEFNSIACSSMIFYDSSYNTQRFYIINTAS